MHQNLSNLNCKTHEKNVKENKCNKFILYKLIKHKLNFVDKHKEQN